MHIVQFVYQHVGVSPRLMFAMLFLSFVGSYVNIPIARLPPEKIYGQGIVDYFGMQYVVPLVTQAPGTTIAVNVGGAVVPVLLSLYLIVKNRLYISGLAAVAMRAAVIMRAGPPRAGVGIRNRYSCRRLSRPSSRSSSRAPAPLRSPTWPAVWGR